MKKIQFICDKCLWTESQILNALEKEEKHLWPIGNQEWCYNCLQELDPDLLLVGSKIRIMSSEELEKYAKV